MLLFQFFFLIHAVFIYLTNTRLTRYILWIVQCNHNHIKTCMLLTLVRKCTRYLPVHRIYSNWAWLLLAFSVMHTKHAQMHIKSDVHVRLRTDWPILTYFWLDFHANPLLFYFNGLFFISILTFILLWILIWMLCLRAFWSLYLEITWQHLNQFQMFKIVCSE